MKNKSERERERERKKERKKEGKKERKEVFTSEVQPKFSAAHFSFRTIYDWTCEHFTEYYDDTA